MHYTDGYSGARHRCASLRIAAALVFALPMAAQTSTGAGAQDVAAWRVECGSDGKTLDCRAVQQLFQRETRQILLDAMRSLDPEGASRGAAGKFLAISIADEHGRIISSTQRATIDETRIEIEGLLEDSPSLSARGRQLDQEADWCCCQACG